ncbi:MAG: histidine phosphatase family protein [Candidatus Micrarchaeota archaeon]
MTRLLLIRHGLTEYNLQNLIQGSLETTLVEHGMHQAQDLARRLRDEKINAIYSSDMTRAVMTAKAVLKYHPNLKLKTFAELQERHFGEFEGVHYKAAKRKEPRLLAQINYTDMDYVPKGGESWTHVQERAMKVINKLLKMHPEDTIAVVAHGGTNRVILASLIGLPLDRVAVFKQNNACVNVIDIKDKKVRIVLLNDTDHTISEY